MSYSKAGITNLPGPQQLEAQEQPAAQQSEPVNVAQILAKSANRRSMDHIASNGMPDSEAAKSQDGNVEGNAPIDGLLNDLIPEQQMLRTDGFKTIGSGNMH